MRSANLLAELSRRNVIRVAGLYLVAAWLVTQVAGTVLPMFGAPDWVARSVVILLGIGFLPAIAVAWAFELTPDGLKRDADVAPEASIAPETGRRLGRLIIVVLAIALVYFGVDKFVLMPRQEAARIDEASAAPVRSIAVLPFEDLSPAHDRGYFSTGMAEELLNALARIPGLKVAGRASSFHYGSRDADLRTIGAALNVANVLEGSVRSQGDAVRISVQLVRTADGFEVWSQSYDGDMHDIFDVQERIARAIASQMRLVLAGTGDARLVPVATTSSEAYSKFLVAETLVNRRFGDSLPRAIVLLREATTLDPDFARAWATLAVAQAVLPQYVQGDWVPSWRASDAAARRALSIDPGQAQAYAALSYNQLSQRHYSAMVEPMRQALALGPDDAAVNYWASNELSSMGRTRAAEARLDVALANDPANPLLLFYKSMMRWRQGDLGGALDYVNRNETGETPFGALMLEFYDAADGDMQGSERRFADATSKMGTTIPRAGLETIYRGTYGDAAQRREAVALVAEYSQDDWAPTLLLQLGEPARSFALFEQGRSGLSDAYLNWLWQPEPWSRKARQDPAFQGFARRIGLVDYWLRNGWPDLCRPKPGADPGKPGLGGFDCD